MNPTTMIVCNAVLDLLVILALFRVTWFGISKPYDDRPQAANRATGHEPLRRAA